MSLFDPRIRLVKEEDVATMNELAQADKHVNLGVSHVITKDNAIIGTLAVGTVPSVLVWMDTKRAHIRDTLAVLNFFENTIAQRSKVMLLPCTTASPFYKYLCDRERSGYFNTGPTDMFVKFL